MHQSILAHNNARYFHIALVLCIASLVAYVWHDPSGPPSGGTWLGYTLGTIAALLIVWLMFLGVRKRKYSSTLGTVQGWTSAHVYLGASLLVVATLHSGLQVGWNVHTLAYVLMCLVIVSGFYGIFTYLHYPAVLAENRAGLTREQLFKQVLELDRQCVRVAEKVDAETKALVQSAAERTLVGGGWWAQVTARDSSKVQLPTTYGGSGAASLMDNADQKQVIAKLAERLAKTRGGEETSHLQALLSMMANKQALVRRIVQDIRVHGLLQLWLYIHVPLSFALLAALIIHIVSVFIYW